MSWRSCQVSLDSARLISQLLMRNTHTHAQSRQLHKPQFPQKGKLPQNKAIKPVTCQRYVNFVWNLPVGRSETLECLKQVLVHAHGDNLLQQNLITIKTNKKFLLRASNQFALENVKKKLGKGKLGRLPPDTRSVSLGLESRLLHVCLCFHHCCHSNYTVSLFVYLVCQERKAHVNKIRTEVQISWWVLWDIGIGHWAYRCDDDDDDNNNSNSNNNNNNNNTPRRF